MISQPKSKLVCVIVDAFQEPYLIDGVPIVLPYSERDRKAQRIADGLTARENEKRQDRQRAALADARPGCLPSLAKDETFSVLLVKVPMDD